MPRIRPVDPNTVDAPVAQLLSSVKQKMGGVPNIIATMANSPAVARAYLDFSQALAGGTLAPRLREKIALAVGESNGCDYCVAAHSALGKGVGLSEEETRQARQGAPSDARDRAAVEFALSVVRQRGQVGDADVERLREAGYTDGEIGEIVAHVALNVFTNYFNLVAQTDIDFPAVADLARAG